MSEWIIGALINLIGSLAINFGTNLLKLGHDERERVAMVDDGIKNPVLKPIIYFQTWRIGRHDIFAVGNFLNFISFGYAAQSLLAALGSIQFISNIAFAFFVLKKTVSAKVLIATIFIVLGNVFLVAFGNHQSPVYTPDQLAEKYSNLVFLLYCFTLVLIVATNHVVYRKNEMWNLVSEHSNSPYWHILLPFCYATVSGAVGLCSVLFAKSLSNLLRLSMAGGYQLNSWFTYSLLLLFLSTAGFWMTRLNEGLSLYDAILIVPMFQIAWTFFSICTGFVYFQEYQVFNTLRTIMFLLGMSCVFIGISLLAPTDPRGEIKDSSFTSTTSPHIASDVEDTEINTPRSFKQAMLTRATSIVLQAKTACTFSLGLGEDSINASSVLVMPMVSSKMTGIRGDDIDRIKLSTPRSGGWMMNSIDDFDENILESTSLLSEISH